MTPTGRLASVGACRVPKTSSTQVAQAAETAARADAWCFEERLSLQALLTIHDFTMSVWVAVAIMAAFALVVSQTTRDGTDETEICR